MTQEQQDKQAEDREAFYMQYFEQFVLTAIDRDINKIGCGVSIYNMSLLLDGTFSDHYLELKPLSAITDEDAIEVAKLIGIDNSIMLYQKKIDYVKNWLVDRNLNTTHVGGDSPLRILSIMDFLRSRGYLLPFRQYTTQQLLDMGWAKLKA